MRAFIRVDFPELGLPIIDTNPDLWGIIIFLNCGCENIESKRDKLTCK
jgi:hypothetical protein